MSARDDLNRYEQDWERHMNWRHPREHESAKPGAYVYEGGGFRTEHAVRFSEMPTALRDRVAKRLEAAIVAMVDEEHETTLAELKRSAIEEAKRTLAELEQAGP